MKRSPLQRKTPMGTKPAKAKRTPWIADRKRPDLSAMACCIEARLRAGRMILHGCMVSGCAGRPEIHHIRAGQGMSQRAPWWETLPLCENHHRGTYSTHGRDRAQFHEDQGTEREMLERLNRELPAELRGPVTERGEE